MHSERAEKAFDSFSSITIDKKVPEEMVTITIPDSNQVHLPQLFVDNNITKSTSEILLSIFLIILQLIFIFLIFKIFFFDFSNTIIFFDNFLKLIARKIEDPINPQPIIKTELNINKYPIHSF